MVTPGLEAHDRIELLWPEKGMRPAISESGLWTVRPYSETATLVPLLPEYTHGEAGDASLIVVGDRIDALSTLRKMLGGGVKLAYADLPRIEGFDESRSFQGESGHRWGTWLSVVRETLTAVKRTMALDGVLVCHAGDLEQHYAKEILFELFRPENYVGSIVWQTHYSPKGGKDSKEIGATHDILICFARDKSSLEKVALKTIPEGYSHPDADPRGPWEARQKDAGRDTVKLEYHIPPYRWQLTKGELPPGLWRVSPMSGVIWGVPQEAGEFQCTIEVTDSLGQSATKSLQFRVSPASNQSDSETADVWWVEDPPESSEKKPRIKSASIIDGVVGKPFSHVLRAQGGKPFAGQKRPSRGWGFGRKTLVSAILEDRCYFGKKGDAIPEPKRYLGDLEGGSKWKNVSSWWDGKAAGWTQDATKHLNDLKDAGVLETVVGTAKPESLLENLLNMFATREGDVVLEVFGRAGDLAATAVRLGRRFVMLAGGSPTDIELVDKAAAPRIAHEIDEINNQGGSESQRASYLRLRVGDPVASLERGDEIPTLNPEYPSSKLPAAILAAEGFIPATGSANIDGVSFTGDECAIVLEPEEFLNPSSLAEIASNVPSDFDRVVVYFFRSANDLEVSFDERLVLRRVPMDLSP